MSSNKNIVIIHYNTPYLTKCLVKSVNKFVNDAKIYIFDNSDKDPFTASFDNVTILDNTKGQIIDFDKWLEKYPKKKTSPGRVNNWASAKHCYSVEKCMELVNENFILLDSDVLLKKDISELFDNSFIFSGEIINQPRSTIKRVLPFICFINVDMCKRKGVHYFDDNYMHGLCNNVINKRADSFDTGAGFYEQTKDLNYKEILSNDYILHFGHGSWNKETEIKTFSASEWLNANKKYWSDLTNKKVVYTCITGGYDSLLEPTFITQDFDYVCFTDNVSIKSNVWDVRPLPKETEELSQIKKQRYVKLNPHKLLSEYEISIWVDGNVDLKGDLDKFISESIEDGVSVYVPTHPSRDCIYAEAKAVVSMRKDAKEIVNPQMERYEKEGFPKKYGLLQSNILLRKHNEPDCIKLMETWFNELKDNSHRDQLSFNYALWKNQDVKVKYLDKYIYKSTYFHWLCKHGTTKPTVVSNRNPLLNRITNANQGKERKSVEQLKEGLKIMKERNKLRTHRVGLY